MWQYGHIVGCESMQLHTVKDVGAAVRDARVQRGLTQAALADRVGVSREWLVRLEHGHPRLEMQLVLDTLAALDLTLTTSESEPEETPQEAAWAALLTGLTDTAVASPDVSSQEPPSGQSEGSETNG